MCKRTSKWMPSGVWRDIIELNVQAWIIEGDAIQALGLTRVIPHMSGETWVHVIALVGSGRNEWQDMLADLSKQVAAAGYDGLQVECRPGWAKACKAAGLKETHRIFEVKLNADDIKI